MASRNRLRQDVTKTLVEQFKDWGLPRDIDYKSYCSIVDRPVTGRAIQKSYYNWKTAVKSVELAAPAVFAPPPPAPKSDPLESLSKASVESDEDE